MSNHQNTLELLRKLGELRSENYEINWEEWEHQTDTDELEAFIDAGIAECEKRFLDMADNLDPYNEQLEEEQHQELEDLIEGLVQGYIYQTMLRKKKSIEDFISSV